MRSAGVIRKYRDEPFFIKDVDVTGEIKIVTMDSCLPIIYFMTIVTLFSVAILTLEYLFSKMIGKKFCHQHQQSLNYFRNFFKIRQEVPWKVQKTFLTTQRRTVNKEIVM